MYFRGRRSDLFLVFPQPVRGGMVPLRAGQQLLALLAEDGHVLIDAEVRHPLAELLARYEARQFGGGSQQAVALGRQVGDGLVAFLGD